jgi:hypothetical protein
MPKIYLFLFQIGYQQFNEPILNHHHDNTITTCQKRGFNLHLPSHNPKPLHKFFNLLFDLLFSYMLFCYILIFIPYFHFYVNNYKPQINK